MDSLDPVVSLAPTPITSSLTGRTVYLNEGNDSVAVLPTFTPAKLAAASREWAAHVAALMVTVEPSKAGATARESLQANGITDDLKAVAAGVTAASTAEELGAALESLNVYYDHVAHVQQSGRQPTAKRMAAGEVSGKSSAGRPNELRSTMGSLSRLSELLILLWKHHLIAFPLLGTWRERRYRVRLMPNPSDFDYGALGPVIIEMRDATSRSQKGLVVKLILSVGGAVEVGDYCSAYFEALRPHAAANAEILQRPDPRHKAAIKTPRGVYALADRLPILQRLVYTDRPALLPLIPQSYRSTVVPPSMGRGDPNFQWAAALDPRVQRWREEVAVFMKSVRDRAHIRGLVDPLNFLLDYVQEYSDVPAEPLEYCLVSYDPETTFVEALAMALGDRPTGHFARRAKTAHLFFRHLLKPHRADSAYRNPIDREAIRVVEERAKRDAKTSREVIPLRFVRMMVSILEDRPRDEKGVTIPDAPPTYSWAKTRKADYFKWRNPESGNWEDVWSPVLVTFKLIRLHLPLRGIQVRMLDSGEGDPHVYRPGQSTDNWVPNTGPCMPPPASGRKPQESQGFIRRIYDASTGGSVNGLYVNTNKTADRQGGWERPGYEIPWQHDEVIRLATELRDWQELHNPISRPLRRDELHDTDLAASPDVAKKLRPIHFLFRDPVVQRHPHEPLTDGRTAIFFKALLDELERRLDEGGFRGKDGEKITLVTRRDKYGNPVAVRYDMHSLRVSGLTHLAAYVPISILSSIVAGHATAVMTYYYIKPHTSQIDDTLSQARAALQTEDAIERDFAAWQRSVPLKSLAEAVVYNDLASAERLQTVGEAGVEWMECGVCPAAGALCHEGGPILLKRGASKPVYAPVPGGPRNCPRCRFFITGPPWLGALAARYNATMGMLADAAERLRELQRRLRAAEQRYGNDLWSRERWEDLAVRRAEQAVEEHEAHITNLLETLGKLGQFIEQAKEIETRPAQEAPTQLNALITVGSLDDVRQALELRPTTDFDLWDRICESSEFYPSINAAMPAVHRGRLYDRMLKLNGQPALFATLTPAESAEAGNALSRWLRTTLGNDRLNAVMVGEKLLEEVGLKGDLASRVREAMQSVSGLRLHLDSPGQRRLPSGS